MSGSYLVVQFSIMPVTMKKPAAKTIVKTKPAAKTVVKNKKTASPEQADGPGPRGLRHSSSSSDVEILDTVSGVFPCDICCAIFHRRDVIVQSWGHGTFTVMCHKCWFGDSDPEWCRQPSKCVPHQDTSLHVWFLMKKSPSHKIFLDTNSSSQKKNKWKKK